MKFLNWMKHFVRSHRTFGSSRTPDAEQNSESATVMPYQARSLVGQQFASWTVFSNAEPFVLPCGQLQAASWARCQCGTERIVRNADLRQGKSVCCGCLREHPSTHNLTGTRIYRIWGGMIQRCTNENNNHFADYGGRGIHVCERWLNSFENFLEDMGPGKIGWTIERVDNSSGYVPSNVVWATQVRQVRNSRHNIVFTVLGITECLSALCERFHAPYDRTYRRLKKGWNIDRAIFE